MARTILDSWTILVLSTATAVTAAASPEEVSDIGSVEAEAFVVRRRGRPPNNEFSRRRKLPVWVPRRR